MFVVFIYLENAKKLWAVAEVFQLNFDANVT